MSPLPHEQVFTVLPGLALPARPVTLSEVGLRERADLQEWIRAYPSILGPEVRIVTYEFDRWISGSGRHSDRLDLLGLDADGTLVVAELKRDGAPDTVEMQAIKYAAYASQFTPEALAACHGEYLRKTVDPEITDEVALGQLAEHCGGIDEEALLSPRIVLVAGEFPQSVTASVVWLESQGLDITLVQVVAYRTTNDLIITVSQLWPVLAKEDLVITPSGLTRRPARESARARQRESRTAVSVILEECLIDDGDELTLRPQGRYAEAVSMWVVSHPAGGSALWRTDDRVKVLEWSQDENRYSLSGLAQHIILLATGETAVVNGSDWWTTVSGTTPAELGGSHTPVRDWTNLHEILDMIRPGEWTTYGELAAVVGTHPNPLGQHLAKCTECHNAWRVLGADGKPRPNFSWSDPTDRRTCREALEEEGIPFNSAGAADPAHRLAAPELRARLEVS